MLYYLHGRYFFVGNCAWFFVLLVLTADKKFFLFKIEINKNIMAILNFLLICAALGIVGAIIEKIWGHVEDILAWLLSFFIPGIGLGLLLFLIMGAGYLFGIFGDIYIF